jgi:protein-S-isoprenylcysteine O-methyltransferase Ste14
MPASVEEKESRLMITSSPEKVNEKMRKLIFDLKSLPWVQWEPGWDTILALVTMLYMIPSYYLMANNLHPLAIYNFLFASLFVLVLLPAYYVLKVRGESLGELGFTKRHWLTSMLISIVIVARLLPKTLRLLSTVPPELVLPTVVFNGLCFWEPFFVHSWVQLRFERAFGIIPGILAVGLCLGSYHIGTYPFEMVVMLGMVGLLYGVVFRLTRNLLILWPVTWTVASTMGTVSGGFTFGWMTVWVYTVILLAQGIGIWWIARTRQNHKGSRQNDVSVSDLGTTKSGMSWRDLAPSCIYSSLIIVQLVLAYFHYNHLQLDTVANIGWLVLMVSGVFGWLPIITLKRRGGVPEKESYMHTTVLVDSGIYSIVRHPQYFAGVLISLAMALITQQWVSVILFIPVAAGFYWDSLRADRVLVEKFGGEYEAYMEKVSGMNPVKAILRKVSGGY